MKKIALYIITLMALCWSCSSDEQLADVIAPDNTSVDVLKTDTTPGVYAAMSQIVWGDTLSATRSTLVLDGSTMKFAWATGDKIGVYPMLSNKAKSIQQALTANTGAQSQTNAEFSPTGNFYHYILTGAEDNKYAAYFPYNSKNEKTQYDVIPVDYTGQTQKASAKMWYYVDSQSGSSTATASATEYNKSEAEASAHLGAYDFMCNCTTQTSTHKTTFDMTRLSAIARFYMQVPDNIVYDSIEVRNTDVYFTTKGTVDISAASPTITQTSTNHTISLRFGTDGFDLSDNSTDSPYYSSTKERHMIVAYMMLAPVDLTSGTNYIYLFGHTKGNTNDKRYYRAQLTLKNFLAGKIYQWSTSYNMDDVSLTFDPITVEEYTDNTVSVGQITVNTSSVTINTTDGTNEDVVINASDYTKLSATVNGEITSSIASAVPTYNESTKKIKLVITLSSTPTAGTGTILINDQTTNSMVTINVTIQ